MFKKGICEFKGNKYNRREMMELKYLNDKVIKKVLSYESKETRNYIARIIAHTTEIPLEELKDCLEPIQL